MAFAPPVRLADALLRFHPGSAQGAALAAAGQFPIDTPAHANTHRKQLAARAAAPASPLVRCQLPSSRLTALVSCAQQGVQLSISAPAHGSAAMHDHMQCHQRVLKP